MTNATEITCPKCHGAKRFAAFAHVDGGRCFECGGLGVVEASSAPAPRAAGPTVSPIESLRALYRAGRTWPRGEWAEAIAEPFDAYSEHSILSGARGQYARLDAADRPKVRAAFLALGVDLEA